MKTVVFRADSSSRIGTGHIMRDLVLAKQYKNSHVIFATQELEGNINHKIEEAGYKIELLKTNALKEFQKFIKEANADLVVIDHYDIDYKYEKKLKKKTGVKILAFDDTYEKHHCDIVLNHNISGDKKRYKGLVPSKCEIRCGSKYTLLRDEFLKENRKKTIFIAMGGADHSHINIKILNVLKKFKYIKVHLVTTNANKNLEVLKEYCKNKKWIKLHINSTKLAKLMKKSDFAIVTPSVTLNEVIFMELPFIAIKTAENQKDIYRYLVENNYEVLNQFNKQILLYNVSLKLKNVKMINFTKLSKIEKVIVFNFRNDSRIRMWMYNKEPLLYKKHLEYIDTLNEKKDRVYYLVKHLDRYIGVVDLTSIDKKLNEAELGIYSNPELKAQGNILMQTILDYSFQVLKLKKVKANVYLKNTSAIALYKRFGFYKIEEKNNLLYMELINENR